MQNGNIKDISRRVTLVYKGIFAPTKLELLRSGEEEEGTGRALRGPTTT